jgi:hypothetical protein
VIWAAFETTEHSQVRLSIQGMTEKPAEELVPLAKSWLRAPALKLKGSGFTSRGYDQTERAYQIKCKNNNESEPLRLELLASKEHPLINPAFVITGWGDRDAILKVDGKAVKRGKEFRFGHRRNPDSIDMIVWVRLTSTSPVDIVLAP